MFADIAGFTAWSSVREPAQVFTLLEQIYGSFDALAKRRGVFKVETIGDCYGTFFGFADCTLDLLCLMADRRTDESNRWTSSSVRRSSWLRARRPEMRLI